MRPYTIVYSDKTFSLSFKEDNHSVTLSLRDGTKEFGSVQVIFNTVITDNHEAMRNAVRNGVEAFNNAFALAVTPVTEEEKELTFEEMAF